MPTCFPTKDIVVDLDQDLAGVKKQVAAQGGVLRLTRFFGTPMGTEKGDFEKGQYNNQYARCGASFLSILKTLLFTYAICAMSESEDNQWLTKRCHLRLFSCLFHEPVTRWLRRVTRRLRCRGDYKQHR